MAGSKITVYEKPTCTTCRVVKKHLTENGVKFEAVNYFEQPLSAAVLKKLLKSAGLKAFRVPPHKRRGIQEVCGWEEFERRSTDRGDGGASGIDSAPDRGEGRQGGTGASTRKARRVGSVRSFR